MEGSQNSIVCPDEAFYQRKRFTPRLVELPLLLKKKVNADQHCLHKHIQAHILLYGNPENIKEVIEKGLAGAKKCEKLACPRPLTKLSRSLTKFCSWQLAPNRYYIKGRDVADITNRPTGMKGPFYSGTLRNDASIYGHLKLVPTCGAKTFYNIPSMAELLNRPYNKHKMKFSTASRYRKPHLRFMVKDLVLCWRDPSFPGPSHYFPRNYCLEKNISTRVKAKPSPVFNFLPNSSVPARETSFLKVRDSTIPGPGRYETAEIACPCQNKLISEPGIWREIELEKRKRFRHLKFKRIKEELYCPCSKVRNIRGHGYTSIFRSRTVRLVERMPTAKKIDRLEKMHHATKYIQMIVNPPRIPISIARIDMTPKPARLIFNSVIKPKMRAKLKQNKRIAFLSGMPRFKDNEKGPVGVAEKAKSKEIKKPISPAPTKPRKTDVLLTTKDKGNVFERLQLLPSRYQQKQVAVREKVFTFSPIPAPQLLLKETDIITRKPNAHFFPISCNYEDFLKDEYRRVDGSNPRYSDLTFEKLY